MLEFIQKKLRERMPDISNHKIDDPVPNDIMMECAHLIQELDDLSIEGADEASDHLLRHLIFLLKTILRSVQSNLIFLMEELQMLLVIHQFQLLMSML